MFRVDEDFEMKTSPSSDFGDENNQSTRSNFFVLSNKQFFSFKKWPVGCTPYSQIWVPSLVCPCGKTINAVPSLSTRCFTCNTHPGIPILVNVKRYYNQLKK
jgi:hypothetical protein